MIPQPDPYILKDYPADVKHSESSQKDRIKELDNALRKITEEESYLRKMTQNQQIRENMLQQNMKELQENFDVSNETLIREYERSNSRYQKIIELTKINEHLSHENALYRSKDKMKQI